MKQAIAVIGSREGFTQQKVSRYLDVLNKKEIKQIITGGARGVDRFAENWAKQNNIDVEVIRPEDPGNKYDYLKRNKIIIHKSDEVIAFWDGHSKGTKHTICYANRVDKPVDIVKL